MKYLKTYNEAYFDDSIRAEISDILCDLTDNNYELTIHKAGTTGSDCFLPLTTKDTIAIWIGKGTTSDRTSGLSFTWDDIKPVIDHLESYLSDRYYISDTKASFIGYMQSFDQKSGLSIGDPVNRKHFTTCEVYFHPE